LITLGVNDRLLVRPHRFLSVPNAVLTPC
jgi:hypothetical protein